MPRAYKKSLTIENLAVKIDSKTIIKDLNLTVAPGQITALMGPNGSGKSTLAHVLMGHPDYHISHGKINWQGKNLKLLKSDQRAKLGLFLAFQYPLAIPGLSLYEFLLTADQAQHGKNTNQKNFNQRVKQALEVLNLSEKFLERSVNEGFSGGEKKKAEILQLQILQPKIAILDETDSGLDIDALKLIAKNVKKMVSPQTGFLVITHYPRLLHYLQPDRVAVMLAGKIVAHGNMTLAKKLEKQGYGWLKDQAK